VELGFQIGAAAGREECLVAEALPTGFRAVRALSRDVAKNPKNIYSDFTRDNTLGAKLLATDLTLE
jgi:hypothetical protein